MFSDNYKYRMEAAKLPKEQKSAMLSLLDTAKTADPTTAAAIYSGLDSWFGIRQNEKYTDPGEKEVKDRLNRAIIGQRRRVATISSMMYYWPEWRGAYSLINIESDAHSGRHHFVEALSDVTGRPLAIIDLADYSHFSELYGTPHDQGDSCPGAILQRLQQTGTTRCIVLLENINELSRLELESFEPEGAPAFINRLKADTYTDDFITVPVDMKDTLFFALTTPGEPLPDYLRNKFDLTMTLDAYPIDALVKIARTKFIPRQLTKHKIKTKVVFSNEVIKRIIEDMDFAKRTPYYVQLEFSRRIEKLLRDNGGVIKNKIKYTAGDISTVSALDGEAEEYIRKNTSDECLQHFELCKNAGAYSRRTMEAINSVVADLRRKGDLFDSHSTRNNRRRLELLLWSALYVQEETVFAPRRFVSAAADTLYGLENEAQRLARMIYHRSVKKGGLNSTVLLLEGPNGTAKTSLAKLMAALLNYSLCEIDMNTVTRVESLCGHDSTYQGSEPGLLVKKITDSVKTAYVRDNCGVVLLLEELEKCPEAVAQTMLSLTDDRRHISDVFMTMDFPLPQPCIIVATTNDADRVPLALRDRFNMHLTMQGYTPHTKKQIISRVVLPQRENMYARPYKFTVEERALHRLVTHYSTDTGLRTDIANLDRVLAYKIYSEWGSDTTAFTITPQDVADALGPPLTVQVPAGDIDRPGAAVALAFGENKGKTARLASVLLPGSGGYTATGNLDSSIHECIQVALAHIEHAYGLAVDKKHRLHIDLVSGDKAVNKGRSIGLALVASIVSALTGTPLKYRRALTGVVSIYGSVLPVDGASLRAKLTAAALSGCEIAVIPAANLPDIAGEDFGIEIVGVYTTAQALALLLPGAAARRL